MKKTTDTIDSYVCSVNSSNAKSRNAYLQRKVDFIPCKYEMYRRNRDTISG